MKKILLIALALMLGLSSYAQLNSEKYTRCLKPNSFSAQSISSPAKDAMPAWHAISQNVTATDINNNTISTADIMSSGKAMVIDFSAVWCSWCWVMHENGILDAIKNQLGSQVEVLWVEADPSTTPGQGLTGGTGSQGDWTVIFNTTTPVPYPIIDDASFTNLIGGSSAISGYPTVVFVSPTGYWCDVYGTSWGFGPYSASDAVSAVSNLLNIYPQAGVNPQVAINGKSTAFVGQPVQFSADIVSVDQIQSITWTFPGADVTTGTGANPSAVTWSTAGTYTVSVSVTNTTGTTTVNHQITIRDGWSWGDEMDYTDGGSYESALGLQSGAIFEWGVLYPAELMTGRNYATKVSAYINSGVTGTYTVRIYQGGTSAPQNLLYESDYDVTESGQWVDFPIPGGVTLDPSSSMWVSLATSGYAASYTTYNEDPNSSMLTLNGAWYTLSDATSGSYEGTWMIKTTTSATAPAFDFALNGPTSGLTGDMLTFKVAGPSDATYNWTFDGGNPATATGTEAQATWDNPGTHTVTVAGTRNGSTVTKTLSVTIIDGSITLPFTENFENGLNYWKTIDADGDGYTWMDNGFDGHSGSCIGSASYINNIGVLTPDNWLITNKFDVPAEGAYIEWWEYGVDNNDYADHYSVYVSYSGNQPSDFNSLIFSGEPAAPKTWVKHSRNFAAGSGQAHVAFRHHDVTNMYWLLIDDVKIAAGNGAGINGVDEVKVDLFPNPTSNIVNVKAENYKYTEIYDAAGRKVLTSNEGRIDMSSLSNGVYVFRVVTLNGTCNMKVVKK